MLENTYYTANFRGYFLSMLPSAASTSLLYILLVLNVCIFNNHLELITDLHNNTLSVCFFCKILSIQYVHFYKVLFTVNTEVVCCCSVDCHHLFQPLYIQSMVST